MNILDKNKLFPLCVPSDSRVFRILKCCFPTIIIIWPSILAPKIRILYFCHKYLLKSKDQKAICSCVH